MIAQVRPGGKGEPLPPGEVVLRFAKESKDFRERGKVNPAAFELSNLDKQSDLKALSVWAESLTTVDQALNFMTDNKDSYRLVVRLNVDQIRALRPEPDCADVPYLDVVWDPLLIDQNGSSIPDTRPGASGHAGLTGLMRPGGISKSYYKSLRSQLADLANAVVLPEQHG